jgi:hypothetical protein
MKDMIKALIVIVVGVALLPVVQAFIDGANATGTSATLLGLVPFLWILGIVAGAAVLAYHSFKG